MPENNKNQFSREEWGQRVRALRNGSSVSPPSVRRTSVNVSGSLGQLKANLDALNGQRLGLAAGNIARQYNLADRLAQTTAELGANQIARREKLYANRQQNLNRMSQLYGNYYQQFGNVLNESALKFLDDRSNISVPTLTAIMAGYEHARASRAEQELAMLDRKSKMLEAQWAVQDKIVETQQQKDANDQLLNMQRIEAQSKANQSMYEAQKAYLDEQARNEMLGVGLASTGRGTGVRALPGMGGVARGAGGAAGRVPADVMGVRSGETVTRGAVPTGTVVRTPDGQTVAIDDNKNVMGIVTKDANGQSVVRNENGQTVGSVDANGNVIPITSEPAMGAYAQYQAAGGGGFWSNPGQNTLGAITSSAALPLVGAYAGALGESARLGYVSPEVRTRYNTFSDLRNLSRDAAREFSIAQGNVRALAQSDPRFSSFLGPNRLENYVNSQRGLNNLHSQVLVDEYDKMLRLKNEASGLRNARTAYTTAEGGIDAIRAARNAVTTADNAGTIARGTGTALRRAGGLTGGNWLRRGLTRVAPRVAIRLGMTATGIGAPVAAGLTALDVAAYGPYLVGGAVGTAIQGARNFWDYASGDYDRRVANSIATGQPLPQRTSAFSAGQEMAQDTRRGFWNRIIPGRALENFGMTNREDVNNFSRFFNNITGVDPDYETKRIFDKLPDISRATILNGMLTNTDLKPENLQAFIDDTIRTTTSPQEQEAIQQQIQAENDQRVFEQSLGTSGDSRPVQAVTEEMVKHFSNILKTDVDYDDVAAAASEYLDVVSAAESRNKSGAIGANTSKGRAESLYQIMPGTLQEWKMSFLKDLGHTLSEDQKELLKKARTANDLDNDLGRPILGAMVLRNIYKDIAIRNQKFDKRGTNIRSDQMFLDLIKMKKLAMDNGQDGIDPVRYGDYLTLWAINHVRGTNSEAVRQGLVNGNTLMDERFGPLQNEQGGNDPWWIADFNGFNKYASLFGVNTQMQQVPQYKFTHDEGVNIEGVNRLLLQRASSANDEFLEGTGQPLHFTSAKRASEKQEELWNNRATNPNGVVARRGNSPHEAGMALDFSYKRALPLFEGSETLKKKYGTMDKFFAAHGLDQGVIKNGKRVDLVHLAMTKDQEYFDTIDHDRYIKARGSWGKEDGNYWMRGVGERPQQVQPAWDVGMQAMLNNFGYPQVVEYPGTEYDPDVIFADNQDGYVFDYDEDGNLISY